MKSKNNCSLFKRAVVLLSGGLDSATTLYLAKQEGYNCFCLVFDYGQRHSREIESARRIARSAGCKTQVIKFSLPWKGSALLDKKLIIAKSKGLPDRRTNSLIPNTYVPARNIIFLSFALSFAEAINARAIFIGAHCQDYSGYPDCRADFFRAFNNVIKKGTKAGVENKTIKIIAPLINKTKAQIIKLGLILGVPFELTRSCYESGKLACGECDSCLFRKKGFQQLGIEDPLLRSRQNRG